MAEGVKLIVYKAVVKLLIDLADCGDAIVCFTCSRAKGASIAIMCPLAIEIGFDLSMNDKYGLESKTTEGSVANSGRCV